MYVTAAVVLFVAVVVAATVAVTVAAERTGHGGVGDGRGQLVGL